MTKRSGDRNISRTLSSKKICDFKNSSLADSNSIPVSDHLTNKIGIIKSESSSSLIDTDDIRGYSTLRMSNFMIVDSVLNETNVDPLVSAILPLSLNSIYQKFINSKSYFENFHSKNEFYRGVGLLGVGVEDKIYKKRRSFEESLKKRCRLRPNPKPRKQFDGTVINRPLKTRSKVNLADLVKHENVANGKPKYNLFTIGNDVRKKANLSKSYKKRSATRLAAAQKLELAKKSLNEAQRNTDDEETDSALKNKSNSIALSRAKRQKKTPQLDFKYCYNGDSGIRTSRKEKEDQFMEIMDSDSSSSVVEVFPPFDRDDQEARPRSAPTKKPAHGGQRVLNLLDKLRLGLQCTVRQTEHDVIIQHLTLEDLATLRSRLQGVASFKNIEAEYAEDGSETARATIDRRVLNLPSRGGEEASGARRRAKEEPGQGAHLATAWARPKMRTVKKVRKLYTQSASTPNILARTQTPDCPRAQGRPPPPSTSSSNPTSTGGDCQVSFYPQITMPHHCVLVADSIDLTTVKCEPSVTAEHPQTTSEAPETRPDSPAIPQVPDEGLATPATAMSASQRLMLKKGASIHNNDQSSPQKTPIGVSPLKFLVLLSSRYHGFTRLIRCFKGNDTDKPVQNSQHPLKPECDDEEPDFELTPSLIAQAAVVNPSSITFVSRPLIQPIGAVVSSNCRSVPLGSPASVAVFPFHPSSCPAPSTVLSSTRLVCANKPASSEVPSLTPGTAVEQRTQITHSPNFKIKHRKWTHNFLTNNNINIREILCANSADKRVLVDASPAPVTSTIVVPNVVAQNRKCTVIPIGGPTKGSSVVLKSLLVGSNDSRELCNLNKSGGWTSKYLATNSSTQDSKIKWQVGGSVVPNHPVVTAVSRETKQLDIINKTDNK